MASDFLKCKNCGKCCKIDNGKRFCRFLIEIEKDKTFCTIYPIRLGVETEKGFHCGYRKDTKFDFEGCPYNTDKPIIKG